jgi:hypothetical protein
MEIRQVGSAMIHADMAYLRGAFRNYANAPLQGKHTCICLPRVGVEPTNSVSSW